MPRPLPLPLVLLLILPACSHPPPAPDTLDGLVSYLFTYAADDDADAMRDGSQNLRDWLDEHIADIEGGVEIGPIADETVDALDGTDRSVEGLGGLAVATESVWPVADVAYATYAVDQIMVYPDSFIAYARDYEGDFECFDARECDWLEAGEEYTSQFAFGITASSVTWSQYRWTEPESGTAFVMRNWLIEPPDISMEYLEVSEQYYLNVFLPTSAGGSYRVQAVWMVYDEDKVSVKTAITLAASSMEKSSEQLDAYLENQ